MGISVRLPARLERLVSRAAKERGTTKSEVSRSVLVILEKEDQETHGGATFYQAMKHLRQAWTRLARRPGRRARHSVGQHTVGDWRPSYWRLSPSEKQRDRHRRGSTELAEVSRRSQSPGLRAPVSRGDCAISRRTVMNNTGSRRSLQSQRFPATSTMMNKPFFRPRP